MAEEEQAYDHAEQGECRSAEPVQVHGITSKKGEGEEGRDVTGQPGPGERGGLRRPGRPEARHCAVIVVVPGEGL
ncbi:hypothetical protein GCM10022630_38370 [Thermobifida alba]